jgi:hypothetical protein
MLKAERILVPVSLLLPMVACSWMIGGSAAEQGPELAKRIESAADMTCIESWVVQLMREEPSVKGGTSVDDRKWPACARQVPLYDGDPIPVERVVVREHGGVTLYLGRIWRLTIRAPSDTLPAQKWPVGSNAYLWYTES